MYGAGYGEMSGRDIEALNQRLIENTDEKYLSLTLYLESRIRSVEVESLMLGRDPSTRESRQAPKELTRLAIPRRVYTEKNMRYVAKILAKIKKKASGISPSRIDLLKKINPDILPRIFF